MQETICVALHPAVLVKMRISFSDSCETKELCIVIYTYKSLVLWSVTAKKKNFMFDCFFIAEVNLLNK